MSLFVYVPIGYTAASMKYIYMPQTTAGLVGISYIGSLLRILLHVSLFPLTTTGLVTTSYNEQCSNVSVINRRHSSPSGNQLQYLSLP
jgi:hypothetical protein